MSSEEKNLYLVREVIREIETGIKNDIDTQQLAESTGYSLPHLCRIFRNTTGVTLATYLRVVKLRLAANELLHSNHSIMRISVEYGFSSQQAFCRAFKAELGCSPSYYRKNLSVNKRRVGKATELLINLCQNCVGNVG